MSINDEINTTYLAYPKSVLAVDGSVRTIEGTIEFRIADFFSRDRHMSCNPSTNRLYVISKCRDKLRGIAVIDTSNNKQVAAIPLDSRTVSSVVVNPQTNIIYVVDRTLIHHSFLWIIDGSTNSIISTIKLEHGDHSLAINPHKNVIYLTNSHSNTLYVIDGSTNKISNKIKLKNLLDIYVNLNTNIVYALIRKTTGCEGSQGFLCINRIVTLDPITYEIMNGFELDTEWFAIAINSNMNSVYIISSDTNRFLKLDGLLRNKIEIIEGKKNSDRPDFRSSGGLLAVNSITNKVYYTNADSELLYVIDG